MCILSVILGDFIDFILHSFDYLLIIVFNLATECCGRPVLVPVHDLFNNDVRPSVASRRRPGTVPQGDEFLIVHFIDNHSFENLPIIVYDLMTKFWMACPGTSARSLSDREQLVSQLTFSYKKLGV